MSENKWFPNNQTTKKDVPTGTKRDRDIREMHDNKLKQWENTEYNILIGQALNLAVEYLIGDEKDGSQKVIAKKFFHLLLELREDEELISKFKEYKSPKSKDDQQELPIIKVT